MRLFCRDAQDRGRDPCPPRTLHAALRSLRVRQALSLVWMMGYGQKQPATLELKCRRPGKGPCRCPLLWWPTHWSHRAQQQDQQAAPQGTQSQETVAARKQHYVKSLIISGPLLRYQPDEHRHTTIFLPFPVVFSIKKKVLITLFNIGDIFPLGLLFNIYFRTKSNIYLVFYYL